MEIATLSPLLRMIGPLIQIACLILILRPDTAQATIAGQPVRPLLYFGFLIGFVLVMAGLMLSRTRRKPTPKDRLDDY